MIVKKSGSYETRSDKPNTNWYIGENNYIIDETTEEGLRLKETYINNYPFVGFEHDGTYVTRVVVLEDEKQIEQERLEQERLEQEMLDSLLPSEKDLMMAEVEISIINILMEVELI